MLVQDIICSAQYFNALDILEEEKKVEVKEFTLEAKKSEVKLHGVHIDYIEEAKSQKELGDAEKNLSISLNEPRYINISLEKIKRFVWYQN